MLFLIVLVCLLTVATVTAAAVMGRNALPSHSSNHFAPVCTPELLLLSRGFSISARLDDPGDDGILAVVVSDPGGGIRSG